MATAVTLARLIALMELYTEFWDLLFFYLNQQRIKLQQLNPTTMSNRQPILGKDRIESFLFFYFSRSTVSFKAEQSKALTKNRKTCTITWSRKKEMYFCHLGVVYFLLSSFMQQPIGAWYVYLYATARFSIYNYWRQQNVGISLTSLLLFLLGLNCLSSEDIAFFR